MCDQVHTEDEIRDADQQFPDHAASPMGVKRQHQVDHAGQNDEPGNYHIDGHGDPRIGHQGKHREAERVAQDADDHRRFPAELFQEQAQDGHGPNFRLTRRVAGKTATETFDSPAALRKAQQEVTELLSDKYPGEKAAEMAKLMTSGTWTHDYPITFERARDLELRVSNEMPENILRLMELYPQPMRRQPSVEYVPVPYRSSRRAASEQ